MNGDCGPNRSGKSTLTSAISFEGNANLIDPMRSHVGLMLFNRHAPRLLRRGGHNALLADRASSALETTLAGNGAIGIMPVRPNALDIGSRKVATTFPTSISAAGTRGASRAHRSFEIVDEAVVLDNSEAPNPTITSPPDTIHGTFPYATSAKRPASASSVRAPHQPADNGCTLRKVFLCIALFAARVHAQTAIRLSVDATDITRRLVHAKLTYPVKPGPFTLLYPQWIPGEHGPTGPIADLVGIKVSANGVMVPWTRDSVNMFAFHIQVPAGTTSLDVAVDYISPPETGGFSSGSSATSEMAVLSWNEFVLYPSGTPTDQLKIQADLKVPAGWRYGTALPIATESGNTIQFQPSSVTTLIDSPVITGRHFRTIDLSPSDLSPGTAPAHFLNIAADSDSALEISPEDVQHYRNLVKETGALFGARHYRDYHFLLSLSDHVAHFGLEHHESSDDRIPERSLIDDSLRRVNASLLPHEFTHSWNGKFRRPAGLATPDYEKPMKGDLLWVYEGLTEYLGEILAPRSGLLTPAQYRDQLAITAATLDNEAGRQWRPLQDTATAAQVLYSARNDYSDYRRGVDYYPEGTLIWFDADVTIRALSNGTKSLNDFCLAFHGGESGNPIVKPYTFEDVVASLNAVQPNDWTKFLRDRLDSTTAHAPLNGLLNSGWKLVYNDTASLAWRDGESASKSLDQSLSIGFVLKEDGTVSDVKLGSAAQKSGLAPSMKIVAVNRRAYSSTILREAVKAAAKAPGPVEFLIRDGDIFQTIPVDYHAGERYPHLERDAAKPDLLTPILTAISKP